MIEEEKLQQEFYKMVQESGNIEWAVELVKDMGWTLIEEEPGIYQTTTPKQRRGIFFLNTDRELFTNEKLLSKIEKGINEYDFAINSNGFIHDIYLFGNFYIKCHIMATPSVMDLFIDEKESA